ncbi:sigma factor-like helix-turn-helix DNA-binding protein [Rhodoplanes sp. SY1]|uniref:sigma factor-like helix-turn-helix DNA-binding protein n=1 Tax=Rhodoplanes sp. SY1 TaxID=3166646 RepID=UPI0038B5A6DA
MPTERLSMRQIRELLRLRYSVGMSQREVARSLGLAQGTVSKYVNRARRAGLTWPCRPISTTTSAWRTSSTRLPRSFRATNAPTRTGPTFTV